MQETTGGSQSRILLMSKDLSAEDGTVGLLAGAGWQVLRASDAVETFAAVKSRDIDLVVLHYPVDDAIDMDLPKVLRGVAPADYMPVMIIAENSDQQARCEHLDSGADEVISDDTSPVETVARVRALLRIKQLQDQLASSRQALQKSVERERKLLAKLRRDNAHLQALCTTDPLTHVQNVRSFQNILAHEFRIARRYNTSLSVMTMDVDHFKLINDTHGHPSGDYVLKELAVILKQSVRESDVVARTGGDEFSILLLNADPQRAAMFADRIRREVYERVFVVYGEDIHATLSIGIASYPADAEIVEPDMLVYFADQALLAAKQKGRDCVAVVGEMSPPARVRLRSQYQQSRQPAEGAYAEVQVES